MILGQDRGYAGDKRSVVQDAMDRVNERRKERTAQLAAEEATRQAEIAAAAKRELELQDLAEEREYNEKRFEEELALRNAKTPEEQAKSDEEAAKLNQDIKQMVNQLPSFDTLQSTQTKINKFLK